MAVMLNSLPSLKFNIGHSKRVVGRRSFPIEGWPIFRAYVKLSGGIYQSCGILDGLIHPVPPPSKVLVF